MQYKIIFLLLTLALVRAEDDKSHLETMNIASMATYNLLQKSMAYKADEVDKITADAGSPVKKRSFFGMIGSAIKGAFTSKPKSTNPQADLDELAMYYQAMNYADIVALDFLKQNCKEDGLFIPSTDPVLCSTYVPILVKAIEGRIGVVTSQYLYADNLVKAPADWPEHAVEMLKALEEYKSSGGEYMVERSLIRSMKERSEAGANQGPPWRIPDASPIEAMKRPLPPPERSNQGQQNIGQQGFNGQQNYQVQQVNNGPQGYIGQQNYQGPQGYTGQQNSQGQQGYNGQQNYQGQQGFDGPQGYNGQQNYQNNNPNYNQGQQQGPFMNQNTNMMPNPQNMNMSNPQNMNMSNPQNMNMPNPQNMNMSNPQNMNMPNPQNMNMPNTNNMNMMNTMQNPQNMNMMNNQPMQQGLTNQTAQMPAIRLDKMVPVAFLPISSFNVTRKDCNENTPTVGPIQQQPQQQQPAVTVTQPQPQAQVIGADSQPQVINSSIILRCPTAPTIVENLLEREQPSMNSLKVKSVVDKPVSTSNGLDKLYD